MKGWEVQDSLCVFFNNLLWCSLHIIVYESPNIVCRVFLFNSVVQVKVCFFNLLWCCLHSIVCKSLNSVHICMVQQCKPECVVKAAAVGRRQPPVAPSFPPGPSRRSIISWHRAARFRGFEARLATSPQHFPHQHPPASIGTTWPYNIRLGEQWLILFASDLLSLLCREALQCTESKRSAKESRMPMCGPKTAACCTVLSTWGLIQLGITGVFMYLGSPALVEDIPLAENRCWDCETKLLLVVTISGVLFTMFWLM